MINASYILPLFSTPTWHSDHVSANQELSAKVYILSNMKDTKCPSDLINRNSAHADR